MNLFRPSTNADALVRHHKALAAAELPSLIPSIHCVIDLSDGMELSLATHTFSTRVESFHLAPRISTSRFAMRDVSLRFAGMPSIRPGHRGFGKTTYWSTESATFPVNLPRKSFVTVRHDLRYHKEGGIPQVRVQT